MRAFGRSATPWAAPPAVLPALADQVLRTPNADLISATPACRQAPRPDERTERANAAHRTPKPQAAAPRSRAATPLREWLAKRSSPPATAAAIDPALARHPAVESSRLRALARVASVNTEPAVRSHATEGAERIKAAGRTD